MYIFIITAIASIIVTAYIIYREQTQLNLGQEQSLALIIQSYKRSIIGSFITFIVGTVAGFAIESSIQPLLAGVLLALWYELIASATISCTVFILLPIKVTFCNDDNSVKRNLIQNRS